jgi:hypothetical protein
MWRKKGVAFVCWPDDASNEFDLIINSFGYPRTQILPGLENVSNPDVQLEFASGA